MTTLADFHKPDPWDWFSMSLLTQWLAALSLLAVFALGVAFWALYRTYDPRREQEPPKTVEIPAAKTHKPRGAHRKQ